MTPIQEEALNILSWIVVIIFRLFVFVVFIGLVIFLTGIIVGILG
jgi:hypothetical protein